MKVQQDVMKQQLLDEINTLISDYKGETEALRKIKVSVVALTLRFLQLTN